MKIDYLSRREKIVMTTISLIHEMGVYNVSMKEIGRREGVSEASLYKHFKSKEELLTSVMEYYEKYDHYIIATLNNSSNGKKDDIVRYFGIYAEYYGNFKEITSVKSIYDALSYNTNFAQRAKQMEEQRTEFLENLLALGQSNQELKAAFVPEHLAQILLGTFDRIIHIWRLGEYSFALQNKVETIIGDLLEIYVN